MLYAIFSCITASVAVVGVLFFVFLLLSTSEYTGMDTVGGWVSCRTCTDTIPYTVYNGNGINNTVVVAVVFFFFCFFLLLSTSEYTGMDTVGGWVSCRTCMDTIPYTVYNGNGINNTVVVAVVFFFFCFFLLLSTSEYTGMNAAGCWVSCRTCTDTIFTMGMVLIILVHIPPSSPVLCSPSQE